MNQLIKKAIVKAEETRHKLGLNMFQPVNVFDACEMLGVTVRFNDINMEGVFVTKKNSKYPTIVISNLRPLPRRCFTCAHELGHWAFGHGGKIDILLDDNIGPADKDEDEILVDAFAGAFLMPIAGIMAEFAKRNWIIEDATSLQFFAISSVFGVGYQTLISNCRVNRLIKDGQAKSLSRLTPAKILSQIAGPSVKTSFFKIVDAHAENWPIDLETSNYLFVPPSTTIEGNHLKKCNLTTAGTGYIAQKPGIVRAVDSASGNSFFIRIQNQGYIGLSENRHLEIENE